MGAARLLSHSLPDELLEHSDTLLPNCLKLIIFPDQQVADAPLGAPHGGGAAGISCPQPTCIRRRGSHAGWPARESRPPALARPQGHGRSASFQAGGPERWLPAAGARPRFVAFASLRAQLPVGALPTPQGRRFVLQSWRATNGRRRTRLPVKPPRQTRPAPPLQASSLAVPCVMSVASAGVSQFSEGNEHDDSMALDDDNAQLVTQLVEAYAADTDAMRELALCATGAGAPFPGAAAPWRAAGGARRAPGRRRPSRRGHARSTSIRRPGPGLPRERGARGAPFACPGRTLLAPLRMAAAPLS